MPPSEWFAALHVAISAVATSALIVLLRPLMQRYALARPNARSSHTIPTPQGGGLAIVAVSIVSLVICTMRDPSLWSVSACALVLGATAALAIVGAADDVVVLRALPRLLCQFVAAFAVLSALPDTARIVSVLPHWIERVVLAVSLVWFINLVNFMDGIDWITVAEVVPVTAGIAIISGLGHAPPIAFVMATTVGGTTLGFAPFNRPVAKLFLGDVGSLPIGLLLGWLLVVVAASGHLSAAILLPLYYAADATITLGRRLARRERVWEAHRTHFYQRATNHGLTVIAIVTRVFATNVVLAALAVGSVVFPSTAVQIGTLGAGAAAVAALLASFSRSRR